MANDHLIQYYNAQLSKEDFVKLSSFIYDQCGIKLPEYKHIMLQSRVQKRLRSLQMPDFKKYIDYLFSTEGQKTEIIHLLDVVTTNKTDFFREPVHFEFLEDVALPEFIKLNKRSLKIWSSACSSGEEPYTIAMVVNECIEKNKSFPVEILATDLSTDILQKAYDGIYKRDRVATMPNYYLHKYFLKNKNPEKPLVKVIPGLRSKVNFQRLNLMLPGYDVAKDFDMVFCRNVLIYFERDVQESVINKLCRHLLPGGYFFLGHSESIINMTVPLEQIKPSIYRKI